MEYIRITKENIDKEHICCAMSNKQSDRKKEWLKARFEEGLVFYRSVERGKCFIEYIPAENAWMPIEAPGYLFINCLWVSGSMKGHGYSSDLLEECIRDAKEQGRAGLCILSSIKRKKEFLSDPKYMAYKGFQLADEAATGITLMYLPLTEDAAVPKFKECAKAAHIEETGFVVYYTDQCPFTYYWVPRVAEVAKEHNIPLKTVYIGDKETAQNLPAPVTTYALFKDGEFVTQVVQSDKKFLALAQSEPGSVCASGTLWYVVNLVRVVPNEGKTMSEKKRRPIVKKEIIPTERLTLRPYSPKDKDRLVEFFRDERITETFMVPDYKTIEEFYELADKLVYFSRLEDTTHLEYGIYLDDRMIGCVNDCGHDEDTIEIGYLIDPTYQGHGYATEALRAVLEEAKEMGFQTAIAGFFEENPASRRVMEKAGMHLTDKTDEEEYRGVTHKCLYCAIEL